MSRRLSYFCLVLFLGLASTSYAWDYNVVIGSWENGSDGWIDWGNGLSITDPANAGKYVVGDSTWSSKGDYCLKLTQQGWNQNLGIKLQNNGLNQAFLDQDIFSIDLMAPADSTPGYGGSEEIYAFSINASGYGNHNIGPMPVMPRIDFWNGSPRRTFTYSWDYSSIKSSITATGTTGYIELYLTTNGMSSNSDVFYFDNARLWSVPEPATMALLGLGGVALLRRKQ